MNTTITKRMLRRVRDKGSEYLPARILSDLEERGLVDGGSLTSAGENLLLPKKGTTRWRERSKPLTYSASKVGPISEGDA